LRAKRSNPEAGERSWIALSLSAPRNGGIDVSSIIVR
jgi:hypothetical protein